MMSNINFTQFNSNEDLACSFAKKVANILQVQINEFGKATLLVSGGNTPKLFFNKLSKIDIEWEKVKVGLVDERWVEPSSKDSNEKLVYENLLQNKASKANFIGLYLEQVNCEMGEKICSKVYKKDFDKADVLILGMGTDGHTASIFPEIENFDEAVDLENKNFCIATTPKTAPHKRMSLSLKAILSAKNLFLHIEGQKKLDIYNEAITDENRYPISKVLCQGDKKVEVLFT